MQELGKHMRKGRIALVGHEPNMGELAAFLIGAKVPLPVQKGRDLPNRLLGLPAQGQGRALLVRHPEDAPEAGLAKRA